MSSTTSQDPASVNDEHLPEWVSARVQFRADGSWWYLLIEEGAVVELATGKVQKPDVTVQWDGEAARAILNYSLQGNDALAVTTVVDGEYAGPPAPVNMAGRPELSQMPSIPGATFQVQYLLRDGPFGDVSYAMTFQEGRVGDELLGTVEKPDVFVDVTYRALARVRAGEITIIEALEGGNVAGELGPLMLLAGVLESEEYHAAELATGRHAIVLAALGQVWRRPDLMFRMRDLLARVGVFADEPGPGAAPDVVPGRDVSHHQR